MNLELFEMAKTAVAQRKAGFVPPAMPGQQPPMDPAMMGGAPPMPGGAPPMDPSMMGVAPPMPGGAPPMDPAMAGGAPPMDPMAMMAAMPPPPPPSAAAPADPAAAAAAPADPAAAGKGKNKNDVIAEIRNMLSDTSRQQKIVTKLVSNLYGSLKLPMPGDLFDDDTPGIPKADDVVPAGGDASAQKAAQAIPDRIDALLSLLQTLPD